MKARRVVPPPLQNFPQSRRLCYESGSRSCSAAKKGLTLAFIVTTVRLVSLVRRIKNGTKPTDCSSSSCSMVHGITSLTGLLPSQCFHSKKEKKCHPIWVILLSTKRDRELKLGRRSSPLHIRDNCILSDLCATWKKTQHQPGMAASYSHQHFSWAKERVKGILWRQRATHEVSVAPTCPANKAWCKKHIVPLPCNRTTSMNLSMVNEALKQGTTPSLQDELFAAILWAIQKCR